MYFLDKTLSLLKAGAKALSHKLNESTQMDSIDLPSPQPLLSCKLKSASNLKQMLLTNKLQLIASDKIISVSFLCLLRFDFYVDLCNFISFQDIQVDLCGCCRMIDQSVISRCYYCDQILCTSCLSACVRCSELFCQNCCLFMWVHYASFSGCLKSIYVAIINAFLFQI